MYCVKSSPHIVCFWWWHSFQLHPNWGLLNWLLIGPNWDCVVGLEGLSIACSDWYKVQGILHDYNGGMEYIGMEYRVHGTRLPVSAQNPSIAGVRSRETGYRD